MCLAFFIFNQWKIYFRCRIMGNERGWTWHRITNKPKLNTFIWCQQSVVSISAVNRYGFIYICDNSWYTHSVAVNKLVRGIFLHFYFSKILPDTSSFMTCYDVVVTTTACDFIRQSPYYACMYTSTYKTQE